MLAAACPLSAVVLAITYSTVPVSHAGRVVAAPHDGYDQYSGAIARQMANQLNWGLVRAGGYRSYPYRYWYDVNRPTERLWGSRGFRDPRWTREGQRVYDEYEQKVRRAARRRSSPLEILVEIHGHSRSVNAGGRNLRLQVIELATRGWTRAQLRRIKQRYETSVRGLPQSQRVPLAIDALDRTYTYQGWIISFYFRASSAKRNGSLRSSVTRRALHFELPPRARLSASARRNYARLLARLVESARADAR